MITDKISFDDISNSTLFKQFEAKCKDDIFKQEVIKATREAFEYSEHIKETFPTYTLHNGTHQFNVITWMGNLLEGFWDNVTDLECGLLLLSACLHDIGMVYNSIKDNIKNESDFPDYLKSKPNIELHYLTNGQVIDDRISEDYCRTFHAKRVHPYLEDILIKYNGFNINANKAFGKLCESHNWGIKQIKDDVELDTEYLTQADLKFCGILLRLADILDFDRTRTPDGLYKALNLANSKNPMHKVSDMEWRKHLSSIGFIKDGQILKYQAHCDNPTVEHEIGDFLNIIRNELAECRELLKVCSNQKRVFELPLTIDVKITSVGYVYGDFKFSLEQDEVITLLMGDSLYSNHEIFIRELLQNSLDTLRHRKGYENQIGFTKVPNLETRFTTWVDNQNYKWVRIDDNGMGMDEYKVTKFFLKIGRSYYNSEEFKLSQLKFDETYKFTPISRFGIGILSCFMVGDLVEVSTRDRITGKPIRLSINGVSGYYSLQNESRTPKDMPNKDALKEGFKTTAGTSIAIRIDPRKHASDIDVINILKSYVLDSESDIFINDEQLLIDTAWKQFAVSDSGSKAIINISGLNADTTDYIKDKFNCTARVFNLHENNKFDFACCVINYFDIIHLCNNDSRFQSMTVSSDDSLTVPYTYRIERSLINAINDNGNEIISGFKNMLLTNFVDGVNSLEFSIEYDFRQCFSQNVLQFVNRVGKRERVLIAHNGIRIRSSNAESDYVSLSPVFFRPTASINYGGMAFGILSLKDDLRPEVSVSRDAIKVMPLKFYSALYYSLCTNVSVNLEWYSEPFHIQPSKQLIVLNDAIDDLYISDKSKLYTQNIFEDLYPNESLQGLVEKKIVVHPNAFLHHLFQRTTTWAIIKRCLVTVHCEVHITFSKEQLLFVERTNNDLGNLGLYPPLFFSSYMDSAVLQHSAYPLNINHPIALWLLSNSKSLLENYPSYFYKLLEFFKSYNAAEKESGVQKLLLQLVELDKLNNLTELQFPTTPLFSQ